MSHPERLLVWGAETARDAAVLANLVKRLDAVEVYSVTPPGLMSPLGAIPTPPSTHFSEYTQVVEILDRVAPTIVLAVNPTHYRNTALVAETTRRCMGYMRAA